jgi:hypothetical protein
LCLNTAVNNYRFQTVTTIRGAELFFLPFPHSGHGLSVLIVWLHKLCVRLTENLIFLLHGVDTEEKILDNVSVSLICFAPIPVMYLTPFSKNLPNPSYKYSALDLLFGNSRC